MNKTLQTIQTLSKIGKVLSKIIFIFSLVGGIGCIVGIISLACIPDGLRLGGVSIHALAETSSSVSLGTLYASMAAGISLCAGEAVLSKLAERYFQNELAAGTPFTFEGAKELLRLGICTVCIPLGTVIIAQIIYHILAGFFSDVAEFSFDGYASVGMGIAFILMSLICKYGAEKENEGQLPPMEERR